MSQKNVLAEMTLSSDTIQKVIFETGRSSLPTDAVRTLILLAGRRGGKDRFFSAVACWRAALCCDWRRWMSEGESSPPYDPSQPPTASMSTPNTAMISLGIRLALFPRLRVSCVRLYTARARIIKF